MPWFSRLLHKSQSELESTNATTNFNHELTSTSSHPHICCLPYELERKIFEIAVYDCPKNIPKFILVARRFKIWFEPQLYQIIRSDRMRVIPPLYVDKKMSDGSISTVLDISRIQAFGHHVHHVLLQKRTIEEIAEVLQCCPNVSNLALWLIHGRDCTPLIPILERLPLRKFSFDPLNFFPDLSKDVGIPFDQPMFCNITHLRVINATAFWWQLQQLPCLPKLTHLAVGASVDQNLLDRVLAECPALELLVVFFHNALTDVNSPPKDHRIVLFHPVANPLDEWERGARGEEDFWITAQVQQAARLARFRI